MSTNNVPGDIHATTPVRNGMNLDPSRQGADWLTVPEAWVLPATVNLPEAPSDGVSFRFFDEFDKVDGTNTVTIHARGGFMILDGTGAEVTDFVWDGKQKQLEIVFLLEDGSLPPGLYGRGYWMVDLDDDSVIDGDLLVNGNAHITGKLTVDGVIDPSAVLLTGPSKKFGATDAGAVYLAPFTNAVDGVDIRKADGTTTILRGDTLNGRIGIGNPAPGTPDAPLHVAGDGHITGNLTVDGTVASVNSVAVSRQVNGAPLAIPNNTPTTLYTFNFNFSAPRLVTFIWSTHITFSPNVALANEAFDCMYETLLGAVVQDTAKDNINVPATPGLIDDNWARVVTVTVPAGAQVVTLRATIDSVGAGTGSLEISYAIALS